MPDYRANHADTEYSRRNGVDVGSDDIDGVVWNGLPHKGKQYYNGVSVEIRFPLSERFRRGIFFAYGIYFKRSRVLLFVRKLRD